MADFSDAAQEAIDSVALEVALAQLDQRQRQIIAGLEFGLTMSGISQKLGVPRSSLYDELERIRKVFQDEGLSPYL